MFSKKKASKKAPKLPKKIDFKAIRGFSFVKSFNLTLQVFS